MSQYFGKTISLISNKGLRYVGILEDISAEDATVSLKQVRSFGTEGRLAAQGLAHMEVMPGADIYDYVVFRGNDVQDLTVLDENIEDVKPKPYVANTPYTPTPTATSGSEASPTGVSSANATGGSGGVAPVAAAPTGTASSQEVAPGQRSQVPAETGVSRAQAPQVEVSATKSTQPAPTSTSERGPAPGSRPEPPAVTDDGEFDFEKANARFDKKTAVEHKPKYDKSSSFFDSISSSNTERGNMRWSEEKSLNMDTFGQEGSRGRGGWRGRGNGRGRGRGRGGRGRGKPRTEPTPEWA